MTSRPGRDRRAERLPPDSPTAVWDAPNQRRRVVVVGGGIAGLAAATVLAEHGVTVTLVEKEQQLGGRVRAWPVGAPADHRTMSRGFHAFFRQYYNLRALLRRADPGLARLRPVRDYPVVGADGARDSFRRLPRTPPWSIAGFVLASPTFRLRDLAHVDVGSAFDLLAVDFPATFARYDGQSAADFLDRLHFPDRARHLALEVFARSFFAPAEGFSAGELVAMFHAYFLGSAEGLLFDVPDDDYDTALWAPLGRYLDGLGVDVRTGVTVHGVASDEHGARVATAGVEIAADAVVLATDPQPLRGIVADSELGDEAWRARIAAVRNAPPFAVHRMWLDRTVDGGRPAFLATAGFDGLDNVSVLERFESGGATWSRTHGGSVVELHAYALDGRPDVRERLWAALVRLYPELGDAKIVADEWLVRDDCWLIGTGPWADRPGVTTPDPRVVLAGDGVRCDLPVALMERAATTGMQAANTVLARWGRTGTDLWTVPRQGRHAIVRRLRGRGRAPT